jgi:hypothetical protein
MSEDELDIEPQGVQNQNDVKVLPAYEQVKISILISWVKIESQLFLYMERSSKGSEFALNIMNAHILSLYVMMLRGMMQQKKKTELIAKLDAYIKRRFTIPAEDLIDVLDGIRSFLAEIGYLNTTYEKQNWEERVRDSYGVF